MIRLHDLRTALQRRHHDADRGSALLLTVVFTIFAGGVMLVLLSVLLSQMQAIQLAKKNTRTGYSAQAGIQATLSVLRSNTKPVTVAGATTDYGDPTRLPRELNGSVSGAGGTLTYSVAIRYYTEDPTNRSDDWLSARALPWPLSSEPAKQPRFARIESKGGDDGAGSSVDGVANRTVVALYTFTTSNVNVPGGRINSKDGTRCMRADAAQDGKQIRMAEGALCDDANRALWVYDTDYRIKLASTLGTAQVLCITGQKWVDTANGTNNAQADATLRPCAQSNNAAWGNQLWSWDDQSGKRSWTGQNRQNTGRSARWLGLDVDKVVEKTTAVAEPFEPTPSVGAGAASKNTNQIVNYKEFGRCADVTDNSIGKTFMIVFPCKQDPTGTGASLNWNHKWYYDEPVAPAATTAPQPIVVRLSNNTPYCLTSSGTANTDLTFQTCDPAHPSTLGARKKFIRNQDTGNASTSYTFQLADDLTRCLSAVPESGYAWSHIRVAPCDGSTAQKWNAPPQTSGSSLGGYKEIG